MKNPKITKDGIVVSYNSLAERARLDLDFVLLTAGAAAICAFGFKMNSPAIVVGAMVISPLLYSVVSVGVASYKKDWGTFSSSLWTMIVGLIIVVGVAALINLFFFTEYRSEIIDRLSGAPVDYFFVALFSGLAGTFAYFWPEVIEAIAGIAISVALIPPVVLVGVGIANFDPGLILGGGFIVLMNVVGIYVGSLLMFIGLSFLTRNR